MLVPGKRYKWFINNFDSRMKDGLFTGEYDKNNGNALLITRYGDIWSVPEKDCITMKQGIVMVTSRSHNPK